jgi:hypothetical protein
MVEEIVAMRSDDGPIDPLRGVRDDRGLGSEQLGMASAVSTLSATVASAVATNML